MPMLKIGDLALPETLGFTAELRNNDTQRRTVSQRLITKLSAAEKWRVTISYEDVALSLDLQAQLYNICLAARSNAVAVTFVSPYTNEAVTINAKCTSRAAPARVMIAKGGPVLYRDVKVVLEQV